MTRRIRPTIATRLLVGLQCLVALGTLAAALSCASTTFYRPWMPPCVNRPLVVGCPQCPERIERMALAAIEDYNAILDLNLLIWSESGPWDVIISENCLGGPSQTWLGLTSPAQWNGSCTDGAFVDLCLERIGDHDWYIGKVLLNEFGHVLGLEHNGFRDTMMYKVLEPTPFMGPLLPEEKEYIRLKYGGVQ